MKCNLNLGSEAFQLFSATSFVFNRKLEAYFLRVSFVWQHVIETSFISYNAAPRRRRTRIEENIRFPKQNRITGLICQLVRVIFGPPPAPSHFPMPCALLIREYH